MRPYRRQLLVLIPLFGIVALVAQVSGVSSTNRAPSTGAQWKRAAVLPGAAVPDIGSTALAKTSTAAKRGEVVRMTASVRVSATKLPRRGVAQVVCGIRYSRDRNKSWTLGSAYETVVLTKRGGARNAKIERSFNAPVADRYRMTATCHVQSPERGANVIARGTMRAQRGLPRGAAIPVAK